VLTGVVTALTLSIGLLSTAVATRSVRLDAAAPADQDQLSAPPSAVTLSFSAQPDPARIHIAVVDSAGVPVVRTGLRVDGSTVVQPVSIAVAGAYRIGYHVGFSNGRELTGYLTFTVGAHPPGPAAAAGHAHGTATPLTVGILALGAVVLVGWLLLIGRRRTAPVDSDYTNFKNVSSGTGQTECHGPPDGGRSRDRDDAHRPGPAAVPR
jgi:methionine-rich copper-binding protein CopC